MTIRWKDCLITGIAMSAVLFWGMNISPTQDLPINDQGTDVYSAPQEDSASAGNSALSGAPVEDAVPAAFRMLTQAGLNVPPGLKVIVFSPHPDDETIAAGGLIQRVVEQDGRVYVVFMTNGDGYVDGVKCKLRRTRTSFADFIQYGKKRQGEAVHALTALGLHSSDALFLGFPDDGLDDLWAESWSRLNPYTSPHTQLDSPIYNDRLNRWAKYDGVDLENELRKILADFKPDWIVLPDPRDLHPDHCTTGIFIMDALRKLHQQGEFSFDDTEVLTYLVHYYDYPLSSGWVSAVGKTGVGGTSVAEDALSHTQWVTLALSAEEQAGKSRALAAHASQSQVLGGFLKQFLLPSELFGRLETSQVIAVPKEYAIRCRRPNS